jgi:hypothetical protein
MTVFGLQVPVEDNFIDYSTGKPRFVHILFPKGMFFSFQSAKEMRLLPKVFFKYFFG